MEAVPDGEGVPGAGEADADADAEGSGGTSGYRFMGEEMLAAAHPYCSANIAALNGAWRLIRHPRRHSDENAAPRTGLGAATVLAGIRAGMGLAAFAPQLRLRMAGGSDGGWRELGDVHRHMLTVAGAAQADAMRSPHSCFPFNRAAEAALRHQRRPL